VDFEGLNRAKEQFVLVNKKVNAKKREQETRRKLVEVERSIVSPAPLILVAPHRMYIKDGQVKFTYKGESTSGNVYILNDCIVLTKTIAKSAKDNKGVVNILLKNKPITNENNTAAPTNLEHHYLETITLKDLEIVEVSSTQIIIQIPQSSKWDFFYDNEDSKREWYTAFKEAIDAYALNVLFEGVYKEEKKNFLLISATYGRLKTSDKTADKSTEKTSNNNDQVEVTDILQKIVEQQGGNQLILNAGSKTKLFGFSGAKKQKNNLK